MRNRVHKGRARRQLGRMPAAVGRKGRPRHTWPEGAGRLPRAEEENWPATKGHPSSTSARTAGRPSSRMPAVNRLEVAENQRAENAAGFMYEGERCFAH